MGVDCSEQIGTTSVAWSTVAFPPSSALTNARVRAPPPPDACAPAPSRPAIPMPNGIDNIHKAEFAVRSYSDYDGQDGPPHPSSVVPKRRVSPRDEGRAWRRGLAELLGLRDARAAQSAPDHRDRGAAVVPLEQAARMSPMWARYAPEWSLVQPGDGRAVPGWRSRPNRGAASGVAAGEAAANGRPARIANEVKIARGGRMQPRSRIRSYSGIEPVPSLRRHTSSVRGSQNSFPLCFPVFKSES